jgi:hypothetical protein
MCSWPHFPFGMAPDLTHPSLVSFFVRGTEELRWTVHEPSGSIEGPAPKQLPPFIHPTGPTPRTKRGKTPLQVFQLFVTTVLLQSIVMQTQVFAAKKGVDFELFLWKEST